jgi:hypothetical protein
MAAAIHMEVELPEEIRGLPMDSAVLLNHEAISSIGDRYAVVVVRNGRWQVCTFIVGHNKIFWEDLRNTRFEALQDLGDHIRRATGY